MDLFWLKHQQQGSQQTPKHMHSSLGMGQEPNAYLGSGVFLLVSCKGNIFLPGERADKG